MQRKRDLEDFVPCFLRSTTDYPNYSKNNIGLQKALWKSEKPKDRWSHCATVVHLAATRNNSYFLIHSYLWAMKELGYPNPLHLEDARGGNVVKVMTLETPCDRSLLYYQLCSDGYLTVRRPLPILDNKSYPKFTLEYNDAQGNWKKLIKFRHIKPSDYYTVRGLFIALYALQGAVLNVRHLLVNPSCFLRVTYTKHIEYRGEDSALLSLLIHYQLGYFEDGFNTLTEEMDNEPWISKGLPILIPLPVNRQGLYIHSKPENQAAYEAGISIAVSFWSKLET
jgi:hypothetical protein